MMDLEKSEALMARHKESRHLLPLMKLKPLGSIAFKLSLRAEFYQEPFLAAPEAILPTFVSRSETRAKICLIGTTFPSEE